jgi:FkbM family methyltransferase
MQVTAFEPDPINFRVLKRNIKMNRLENVKAFNFGLGDKEEKLTFYGFSTGVSIEPSWAGNVSKRKFIVQVKKLDDFLKNEGMFDHSTIMKIDVEGFEENVVSGAEEFIRNSRNLLLIIEMTFTRNQRYSREYRKQAYSLIKKLIKWGYEPMQISLDGSLVPARQSILDSFTDSQSISISRNFAFHRSQ